MKKRFSKEAVLDLLSDAVLRAGGQRAYAEQNKVSQGELSLILAGKRDLAPKILAALGLRRVIEYERAE